jgi:hypothetical protein
MSVDRLPPACTFERTEAIIASTERITKIR